MNSTKINPPIAQREFSVAILLPTRGRTVSLTRSVMSLINRAHNKDKIEFVFAFDNDDEVGIKHWATLQPLLDERGIIYTVLNFEPMGYENLHQYYNKMCEHVDAHWLVIWNDDAVMESQNWDREIARHTGEFKLLAFHAHREHPYSIFPITPIEWVEVMGYLSGHSMSDAWISQIAYMVDIFERIPVWVTHDRNDLTGNNCDETYKNRKLLEGNPSNPSDFHHRDMLATRYQDAAKLSNWLSSKGVDQAWFRAVVAGQQDPWAKLKANDINDQMKVWEPGMRREIPYKKNNV